MPALYGYWKIRGIAQPTRYLMEYAGEEYEERYYDWGPAPEYSKEQWLTEKYSLGLTFPNLPYYIDGDVKITQSNAILRYIARKHNLLGRTPEEVAQVDMLIDVSSDYRNASKRVFYHPDYENMKDEYLTELEERLTNLENQGKGTKWFVGDNLTAADFTLYEYLSIQNEWRSCCFEKFPWLRTFMDNFEAIPAIKKYQESEKCIKAPINGRMATWGGK